MGLLILDNRCKLAWNEYGLSGGEPVFYFHGMPGSRLEVKPAEIIARDSGLRLIAPDRPGYGDSDAQDNFKLLDWPAVVSQLADRLNINRFSILGFSGGGPYALACAHAMPERIKKVTLFASPAPYDSDAVQEHIAAEFKPLYDLAITDIDAARQQVSQLATSPDAVLNVFEAALPPEDKTIISNRVIRSQYLDNLALSLKTGIDGFVGDLQCYTSPWGFNLQDITTNIDIWHGRNDKNIGFAIGTYLAAKLQNSATHFLDDTGHLYLLDHWLDALESLKK